jgi:GT2 family glycosyltransferase
MEDVDFCVRARRGGFASGCAGMAAAYHHGSASTGGGYTVPRKYMMGVNSVWFLRRFGRPIHWARFVLFDVLTLPGVLVLELARGRGTAVLAKAKGIFDGLRGMHVHPGVVETRGGTMWRWRPLVPQSAPERAASPGS